MNIQAIIVTNCISCAILIILLASSHLVRKRRHMSDKLFSAMIVLTMTTCIIEMFTFIMDGKKFFAAIIINMLGNTFLYFATLLITLLWYIYADLRLYHDEKRIKDHLFRKFHPVITGIFILTANLKWNFLFTIDKSNTYHREPLSTLFYILVCLYLGSTVIKRIHYRKTFGNPRFFPIWMFLIPVILGTTAQLIVYGISVAWCSVSLGLAGIYMALQNELSYLDPLTKLFNRTYLDQRMNLLSCTKKNIYGIMLDMDDFKSINDRFGHAVGDAALVDTAHILRSAVREKGDVFRFAGDEFIILLRTYEEKGVDMITDSIKSELNEFNSSDKRQYTLSFSMGYSLYNSENSTPDSFLKAMDAAMYEEKRVRKSRRK